MSAVTTSSLSDTLPLTVPKLDAEGDNWAIFYVCFMDTVEAKGFWSHFDGSLLPPVTTTTSSDTKKTALAQWEKDECSVKMSTTTGFYGYGDTLEENHKGQMGSCGEGIYSEGGICTDGNEGEVFDVEVSGEGECKGFFERIEVEKGGVGTGGGNDQ